MNKIDQLKQAVVENHLDEVFAVMYELNIDRSKIENLKSKYEQSLKNNNIKDCLGIAKLILNEIDKFSLDYILNEYNFFLSYSTKDKELIYKFKSLLEKEGFKNILIDEDFIRLGSNIEKSIEDKLLRTDFYLLFISENSLVSPWVGFEYQLIRLQNKHENQIKFIFFVLDDKIYDDNVLDCLTEKMNVLIDRKRKIEKTSNSTNTALYKEIEELENHRNNLNKIINSLKEQLHFRIDDNVNEAIEKLLKSIPNNNCLNKLPLNSKPAVM
jgi:hypothetical protein